MNKKIFLGSIIAVVILTIPISSAIDLNADIDNKLSENSEIETLDTYNGIISFIYGTCSNVDFKGKGLIRSVEFWSGYPTCIDIVGFRIHVTTQHVIAPRFIGFTQNCQSFITVFGITLGNIEYSSG